MPAQLEARLGRQLLGRVWSDEAAKPLLGSKKENGTRGTCGDSTFLSRACLHLLQ